MFLVIIFNWWSKW